MAKIISDCPYIVCDVEFDATIWSPHVGLRLGNRTHLEGYILFTQILSALYSAGKINLCSPDHVSLLVHRTFNVSIPRYHIPTDEWEFEYGAAENDPEFGTNAVRDDADVSVAQIPEEHGHVPGGKWVHKITGDSLGGPSGDLDFIVIGSDVILYCLVRC
jgi:DNA-directed RNA polymerase I subunit RPA43